MTQRCYNALKDLRSPFLFSPYCTYWQTGSRLRKSFLPVAYCPPASVRGRLFFIRNRLSKPEGFRPPKPFAARVKRAANGSVARNESIRIIKPSQISVHLPAFSSFNEYAKYISCAVRSIASRPRSACADIISLSRAMPSASDHPARRPPRRQSRSPCSLETACLCCRRALRARWRNDGVASAAVLPFAPLIPVILPAAASPDSSSLSF